MLLDRIRQVYPELTKSQKALADFVAANYRDAAFMTAAAIAQRLGVNEATVIRFAQRLGYAGFPEFALDVKALVRDELQGAMAGEGPAEQDPLRALLQGEVNALRSIVVHIAPETWQQSITVLREARQVLVLGQGLAAPLAQLFALALQTLGIPSQSPVVEPLSLAMALRALAAQDAIVGIAITWESPEVARAVSYARQQGIPTLALSPSPLSPCAQAAEWALSWQCHSELPLPPLTPAVALIDALLQGLCGHEQGDATDYLEGVSKLGSKLRGEE